MHKRLVAGLSGLVTCLQSNFIGTNFAGFCSNLGVCGLFSSPLFLTGYILIGWLQVTRWGRGIPPFHGKPKPRPRPPASPSPSSPTGEQTVNMLLNKVLGENERCLFFLLQQRKFLAKWILFVSVNLTHLDISYKGNHESFVLLLLAFFT